MNGLEKLRETKERCHICRYATAEATLLLEVQALGGEIVKAQCLPICGECATLGYQNIQNALERTVTQQKQSEPVEPGEALQLTEFGWRPVGQGRAA